MCREFPFRFKAACSLSSYLSTVIYFLISLSRSLCYTSLSLSLCVWIYLVVMWAEEGRWGESIKVSGDNCFPHRSLVSFLHYLSCFAVYLFICRSCFAPPRFLVRQLRFLQSEPLSFPTTTRLHRLLPSKDLYWFYSPTISELWNYKIGKL